MRTYAALFNNATNAWSVIFRDQNEEEWYVYVKDAGDKETAKAVATSLNAVTAMAGR